MPDTTTPFERIHRVTTRRRSLRALECPLDPELIVAEFSGELPPEVALAVYEHIAVCEICGANARRLREPYELLSSVGAEPVPSVPDLRDAVREKVKKTLPQRLAARAARAIGRGGTITAFGLLGVLTLIAVVSGVYFMSARTQPVAKSSNAYASAPAVSASGVAFAQTEKLATIHDQAGRSWQVAEVVVIGERDGKVQRSLPASQGRLQIGAASQRPIAVVVSPDGKIVYQVTAPEASGEQALVAIDATTGEVRYVAPIRAGANEPLPAGWKVTALALSPNGAVAYAGLQDTHTPQQSASGPQLRALALDPQTGAALRALTPAFTTKIPMPPPPGSLPVSAFPNVVPQLDATPFHATVAAQGDIAVSPDGRWLFDALLLSDARGPQYAVVRRIDAQTGATAQELALAGDFSLAKLGMSGPAALYLIKGSPDAQCFALDASGQGPTLISNAPLGGPAAPKGYIFTGALSASPAADPTKLYIAQNASTAGGQISGHDLWLVDLKNGALLAHRVESDPVDAALTPSGPAPDGSSYVLVLRGGQISALKGNLVGSPVGWLKLEDGRAVTALLTTAP